MMRYIHAVMHVKPQTDALRYSAGRQLEPLQSSAAFLLGEKVLVILLTTVKLGSGFYINVQLSCTRVLFIQFFDESFCHLTLFVVQVKDAGTILAFLWIIGRVALLPLVMRERY